MKNKLLFLSFLITVSWLLSCVRSSPPPLPAILNIQMPSPDTPPEIAAFSGIWEGKWGGDQEGIIVVEKIDKQKAEIIFSRGSLTTSRSGFLKENTYDYYTASVLPGPVLEWRDDVKPATNPNQCSQCPCKLTLDLVNKDLMIAYYEYIDYQVKMRADLRRRKYERTRT